MALLQTIRGQDADSFQVRSHPLRRRVPWQSESMALASAFAFRHDAVAQRLRPDYREVASVLEHVHDQFGIVVAGNLELVAVILAPGAFLIWMPAYRGYPSNG